MKRQKKYKIGVIHEMTAMGVDELDQDLRMSHRQNYRRLEALYPDIEIKYVFAVKEDRDGKSNGTYTNFVSYVKALNIDAMKMHPEWVTQTERQLHDIDIWAKALGDEDVKAKDALIKKCSELSQKIGVKDE